MANTKIYLDKRYPSSEVPVKIMISHKRRTILIPTGVKVPPAAWDEKSQSVVGLPNAKTMNTIISLKRADVERELLIIQGTSSIASLSTTELRDRILNKPKKETRGDFMTRFERFISIKSAKQTKDSYEWTLKKLREFDAGIEKRSFEDISKDYLYDFLSANESLSKNSKSILMRNIRAVFNDAIDSGITSAYPFRKFVIPSEKTRKKALTIEQLRTLFSCECEQEEYRDMFKLMFFLRGINTVDLLTATKDQVVNGRLEYRRSKVGTLLSVKIEPEIQALLDKYKGKNHLLSPLDRYKDYRDYQHHLNYGLKQIGCIRGKNRKIMVSGMFPDLSSNWARHSWATAAMSLDVPKEVISKGLGHSFGVAVTDVYIDFDMRKVDDANRKIIDAVLR